MGRTGQERLDAIEPAMRRRDDFRQRVEAAGSDWHALADLMAEAVTMQIDANSIEPVGRNGKATIGIEHVFAAHCLIAAKEAYLRMRYGTKDVERAAVAHNAAPFY